MVWVDEWPPVWRDEWGDLGRRSVPARRPTGISTGPNIGISKLRRRTRSRSATKTVWQLFVRDENRNVVAEIDDYTKATLLIRVMDASARDTGKWTVELPRNCNAARKLLQRQAGIVAMRNGEVLLSGPVHTRDRSFSDGRSMLVVSGPDDLTVLADRVAMPEPSVASPPFDVRRTTGRPAPRPR
jgi:hypothetical protein